MTLMNGAFGPGVGTETQTRLLSPLTNVFETVFIKKHFCPAPMFTSVMVNAVAAGASVRFVYAVPVAVAPIQIS